MVDTAPGVWLVGLEFPWGEIRPPVLEHVGDFATLEGALRAMAGGAVHAIDWPLTRASIPTTPPADVFEWLRDATPAPLAYRAEAHLVQCVVERPDELIAARYLFDRVYLRAHPEALDREHLALLHGIVAAKLLDDDGALVLDRVGIAASLRWVGTATRGVRLGRNGQRTRG